MEQLSAFLDKQLPLQEQAFVDAHLHSCEQCRLALVDLRATVALVRAMPQATLPRSFTLPVTVTPLPIQAAREARQAAEPVRRQPVARSGLRRSLRFASAIAAVLGLLFILSGLLPAIAPGHSTGGAATLSSAPQNPSVSKGSQATPAVSDQAASPGLFGTHVAGPTQTGQKGPTGSSPSAGTPVTQKTQPGTPTQAALQGTGSPPRGQTAVPPALPPYLDLGTLEGRLSLGLALALLGMIGLLVTRRRYQRTRY
jgi:anti-sigma factor RsiW